MLAKPFSAPSGPVGSGYCKTCFTNKGPGTKFPTPRSPIPITWSNCMSLWIRESSKCVTDLSNVHLYICKCTKGAIHCSCTIISLFVKIGTDYSCWCGLITSCIVSWGTATLRVIPTKSSHKWTSIMVSGCAPQHAPLFMEVFPTSKSDVTLVTAPIVTLTRQAMFVTCHLCPSNEPWVTFFPSYYLDPQLSCLVCVYIHIVHTNMYYICTHRWLLSGGVNLSTNQLFC